MVFLSLERLWLATLSPGPARRLCWPVLAAAAVLFHCARLLKFWVFRLGLFPRTRLKALTLSVGNLAVGGAGKTPVVQAVARQLSEELDVSTAVLCRGYGSRNREWVRWISRDGELAPGAELGGDEAWLLARSLSKASVIVGKRRALAGRAADLAGCAAVILDDGFQYWRLERDVELVCFNMEWPLEWFRPFPLGILREPLSRLRDVSFVVVTGEPAGGEAHREALLALLRRHAPRASAIEARFEPTTLSRPGEPGGQPPAGALAGRRVLALSNIAHPRRFHRLLQALGAVSIVPLACADHHVHERRDLDLAAALLLEQGCDLVISTEKDEQSLLDVGDHPLVDRLRILRGEARLAGEGLSELRSLLAQRATREASSPWRS